MFFSDALVDQLRNKINKLENDLKKIRHEVRNKEDLSIKLETRLKDMQNQRSIAQKSADDVSNHSFQYLVIVYYNEIFRVH